MTEQPPSPSGAPAPRPPRAPRPAPPPRPRPTRSRAKADRWAHRRAEPRMLAFAWTMYLLVATGLAFARIGLIEPVDVQVYRASARALLLSVAIGACALWPMVRLSQAFPARPLRDTFKDLLVIVAPMQAVIWGQALLSRWPISSLAAVAVALAAWTGICGGLLAMALAPGAASEPAGRSAGGGAAPVAGPARRVAAMLAILAVTCAGALVVAAEGMGPRNGLLTPFTLPWALLGRDLTVGYTLGPTSAQWGGVIGLCLAAGAPWLVAAAMGGRPPQGANNRPLAESAAKR